MLAVDAAALGQEPGFLLVTRVEVAEEDAQFLIGVLGEVHFPDALVAARKGKTGAARLMRGSRAAPARVSAPLGEPPMAPTRPAFTSGKLITTRASCTVARKI